MIGLLCNIAKILLLSIFSTTLLAIEVDVQGTIRDAETDEPLIGASVLVKDSQKGTVTDIDGGFQISVSIGDILLVSYVGYETQEIQVSGSRLLDIKLKLSSKVIDEVIVVGYTTKNKADITGAIVNLDVEAEIGDRPVSTISQMLQGSIANLNISNSNNGGEPGTSQNLNIRGVGTLTGNRGEPYILLDGMPVAESRLTSLSANDIKSISVLKDAASAAIYGSRGAYGVILITTKSGGEGKAKFDFSSNWALARPTIIPDMANSIEFAEAYNLAATNNGAKPIFDDETLQLMRDYQAGLITEDTRVNDLGTRYRYAVDGYANYDWYDVMYRDNAPRRQYKLGISGGNDKTSYYLSGNFFGQEGNFTYANDTYDRMNFMMNLNSQVTSWMSIQASAKYSRENFSFPSGGFADHSKGVIYHQISRAWPNLPLYAPDGSILNYDVLRISKSGDEKKVKNGLIAQGALNIEPIKNWKTRLSYNFQNNNTNVNRLQLQNLVTNPDGTTNNVGYNLDEVIKEFNTGHNVLINLTSEYQFSVFEDHNFNILVGYEQREENYSALHGSKSQLITPNVPTLRTAVGEQSTSDGLTSNSTRGVFSSLSYNYQKKYFVEGIIRVDESSFFREGKRRGVFPSLSLGYNLVNETFWNVSDKYISLLKLRASWGQLGNHDPSLANRFQELLRIGQSSYLLNGARPNMVLLGSLVSPNLTWETVTTVDVGLDANLLDNRMEVNFDWYNRTTSNMIGPVEALPAVLGVSAPVENNATLETKGWEISWSWKEKVNQFSYRIGFNLGDNRSVVKTYHNPTNTLSTHRVGKVLGEIWGYETIGYFDTDAAATEAPDQSFFYSRWGAGDIQYADVNADGKINNGKGTYDDSGDLRIIGNSASRYNFGVNLGAGWHGFDLSVLLQGIGKRDFMFDSNANLFWGFRGNQWQNSISKAVLDYWTPDNTDAYYPKPYMNLEHKKNTINQTKYLQDASFVRLKNVQLGYSLPGQLLERFHMDRVHIYFSGENLMTFTKLHENFDPEALGGDWDEGKIYPLQKVISLGLNVGL